MYLCVKKLTSALLVLVIQLRDEDDFFKELVYWHLGRSYG